MKNEKTRSKFLKIVDEKHDINFHWPKVDYWRIGQGRVLFEVFEKLTSACLSKFHEKPCYYLYYNTVIG